MIISIDFDKVIADTQELKDFYIKNEFQKRYPELSKDAPNVSFEELETTGVLPKTILREITHDMYADIKTADILKPILNSVKSINKLSRDHTVKIVTARSDESLDVALKWLATYKVNENIEVIGVGYTNSKRPFLEGSDVFIDDRYQNFEDVYDIIPHLLLMNGKYWQDYSHPKVTRVYNWNDIMDYIVKLNK
ncbi:MAG: hypothetical protein Q9M91_00735 [Candidatus Dojkabacteria bacterium]|nr:hypothetical protein [Candidatus Dojkabacteria bacterium]MDQ7020354.1 hypothetical protein [Candidatus Dojkabacteria bacterium]